MSKPMPTTRFSADAFNVPDNPALNSQDRRGGTASQDEQWEVRLQTSSPCQELCDWDRKTFFGGSRFAPPTEAFELNFVCRDRIIIACQTSVTI